MAKKQTSVDMNASRDATQSTDCSADQSPFDQLVNAAREAIGEVFAYPGILPSDTIQALEDLREEIDARINACLGD